MTVERIVRIVAGLFVLISLSLGVEASPIFHHSYWLFFTAFVGLNLFQSGITRWCLMASILEKAGVKTEAACARETASA
ncbi:MAG: DUF2892 domain-containing protein [Leptospiraceae bacterium]|nr:DUF2892 domain-containing protein [Leptospiraceae bacterium]